MLFSDFCIRIYPYCTKYSNYKDLFDDLAKATKTEFDYSDSYKRSLTTGTVPFNKKIKSQMRGRDNLQTLIDFFMKKVPDENVLELLLNFGVSEIGVPDKSAMCVALAHQIKAIIDSDEEDADNIFASDYLKIKNTGTASTPKEFGQPRYPHDKATVISANKHTIEIYDKVRQEWEIVNDGSIHWIDRKLVYKRGPKDRPEAKPSVIEIGDVPPGEKIKIATTFDGRGFEGVSQCIWEMQDSEGNNCFPDQKAKFCVTITAKFKPE